MNTRTQHARTYICHMPVYYYAYVYLKVARVPVVRDCSKLARLRGNLP